MTHTKRGSLKLSLTQFYDILTNDYIEFVPN